MIERAVVLCDSDTLFIDESWFMRQEYQQPGSMTSPVTKLAEYGRETIETALVSCRGRVAGSSGALLSLDYRDRLLNQKSRLWELIRIDSKFGTPVESPSPENQ